MTPEERAIAELQTKSLDQIQVETAYTWAYRAWAAYKLGLPHDAVEYAHEAIEHAALSENNAVLAKVREIINSATR